MSAIDKDWLVRRALTILECSAGPYGDEIATFKKWTKAEQKRSWDHWKTEAVALLAEQDQSPMSGHTKARRTTVEVILEGYRERQTPNGSYTQEHVDAMRLANAAPEMLEALKHVLDDWHADGRNFHRKEPDRIPMVRAAIAKAEGRET